MTSDELTFRQMVDGISSLVAVLTPDGRVDFVNRQVLDYFGKTLEELKEWASTDAGAEPDVVIGCAGDVPTLEALAAVDILRHELPELRVRAQPYFQKKAAIYSSNRSHRLE